MNFGQQFAGRTNFEDGIVVIASSTGGPKALGCLFQMFPPHFPLPIVAVQHITHGFIGSLVETLQARSELEIRLATDGERLRPGAVFFAPDDYHLIIRRRGVIGFDASPPTNGHRPSADVLFSSVAKVYGSKAIAVILTGMGKDGAEGIKEIREAGGFTIAQDERSSVVFGMPKASIQIDAIDEVLPLQKIVPRILQHLKLRETIAVG